MKDLHNKHCIKKSLVFALVKQRQNFIWACFIMLITVICLLTGKKADMFKADTENVNFPSHFCLGNISEWV